MSNRKGWLPEWTPADLEKIMGHQTGKSMLLLQLMGMNQHARTEIDKAKKPGRKKRKRIRYRSIDDA